MTTSTEKAERKWLTPDRFIARKKSASRRVTGSIDIPLDKLGKEQAEELASNTPKLDRVEHGPKARTIETAEIVAKKHKIKSIANGALRPWRLGGYEAKPYSEVGKEINRLMVDAPNEIPKGKGDRSTDMGESAHEFTERFIGDLDHAIGAWNGTERILKVTHGRNLAVADAWIKAGKRHDHFFDPECVIQPGEREGGDLFLAHPGVKELTRVKKTDRPGIYYARHGETEYSSS